MLRVPYRQNSLWMTPAFAASVISGMDSAEETFKRTVGATIIEFRLAIGITSIGKLADELKKRGVASSESTVRRWESGGGVPDAWELFHLCQIFGCDPSDLVRPKDLTDREIQLLRRARKAANRGLEDE